MKIVITEPVHIAPDVIDMLSSIGTVSLGPFNRQELVSATSDADILMVRLTFQIDKKLLAGAAKLKAIVSATTGTNHIDLDACKSKEISVITLKGETGFLDQIASTAEHAFGLILALARQLPSASQQVLETGFARCGRTGFELRGKYLGIIGCGRLGKKVAGYGSAFGMEVIGHDPYVETSDLKLVPKAMLLDCADFISIHASHTDGAPKILDATAFRTIKSGAFLVNTARGELIDENALLESLEAKKLGGAALDVAENETRRPQPDPLVEYAKQHDNLILTPHIGGSTFEGLHRAERFVVEKLVKEIKSGAFAQ